MRGLLAVILVTLGVSGCTCQWGAEDLAPTEPDAVPEAVRTRAVHPKRTDPGQPSGPPVIQQNVFLLPLAEDVGLPTLRAAIQRAWERADPEGVDVLPEAPQATCSRERRWHEGTDLAVLRVHQDACGPNAQDRSWRVLLHRGYADRPVRRGRGGRLRYSGMHMEKRWTSRGWDDLHILSYERRGPARRPPPDDSELRARLPPGPNTATPFDVQVQTHTLGEVVLHRERIQVGLDTRRCTDGRPAGHVITFTSRRRPPGHTPNNPLDAEVVSEVNSFGVLLASELQGRLSDAHPDALAATCQP